MSNTKGARMAKKNAKPHVKNSERLVEKPRPRVRPPGWDPGDLSVRQMLLFEKMYPLLKAGMSKDESLRSLQIEATSNTVDTMLRNLNTAFKLPALGELQEQASSPEHSKTAAGIVYNGVVEALNIIRCLLPMVERAEHCVPIASSEYLLTWFFPQLLDGSKKDTFLDKNEKMTLDLRRHLPAECIKELESERVELAVIAAPNPLDSSKFECTRLFGIYHSLIYHADLPGFPRQKTAGSIRPSDFSKETPIFIVRPEIAPASKLLEALKAETKAEHRFVYVDSVLYMYNFVAKKAGIGIYVADLYNPFFDKHGEKVHQSPLDNNYLPVEISLLHRKKHTLSIEAEIVKRRILDLSVDIRKRARDANFPEPN
jgi:DNA-binding transcriptional LysR family regulator